MFNKQMITLSLLAGIMATSLASAQPPKEDTDQLQSTQSTSSQAVPPQTSSAQSESPKVVNRKFKLPSAETIVEALKPFGQVAHKSLFSGIGGSNDVSGFAKFFANEELFEVGLHEAFNTCVVGEMEKFREEFALGSELAKFRLDSLKKLKDAMVIEILKVSKEIN